MAAAADMTRAATPQTQTPRCPGAARPAAIELSSFLWPGDVGTATTSGRRTSRAMGVKSATR